MLRVLLTYFCSLVKFLSSKVTTFFVIRCRKLSKILSADVLNVKRSLTPKETKIN